MKKLLLAFVALLSLSSCDVNDRQVTKTPLGWCLYEVLQDTVSVDEYVYYTYTDLHCAVEEEQKIGEIVKQYIITTYCYEENYNDFVKTEWACGIAFTRYYRLFVYTTADLVHINDIIGLDCDVVEKTICNEGELESC